MQDFLWHWCIFTVCYWDFYLKWKQLSHYDLSKFFLLFVLQRQLIQFPFSLKAPPFYICSYSLPVLGNICPSCSWLSSCGGDPEAFPHQMQYLDPAACFLIFPAFIFSQLVQIIATGRRPELMSPPAQLFPVNKRKDWFYGCVIYLFHRFVTP